MTIAFAAAPPAAVLPGVPVARTAALAQALEQIPDRAAAADLLFLETWEIRPTSSIGSTLRAQQLRRANPALAAAIRTELNGPPRPLR